jgi:hypothetical protein
LGWISDPWCLQSFSQWSLFPCLPFFWLVCRSFLE